MKGRKKMLGHNSNKKTLIDFIREGRCKITNEIANRYLVCNIVNGEKKETILYDSEVIGLRNLTEKHQTEDIQLVRFQK
jgi:hypothetical protein